MILLNKMKNISNEKNLLILLLEIEWFWPNVYIENWKIW